MYEKRYIIGDRGNHSPYDASYVSQLAHHYAGKDNVIGFSTLGDAIIFAKKEDADAALSSQPEWLGKRCEVTSYNLSSG